MQGFAADEDLIVREVVRLGGPVPPFFFLRDPDGNTLQVVEDK